MVVLSLDGMRHDYPDRIAQGAFSRLEKEGVRARRMLPPFPASTFPSHVTLATGCYPERHGILNSRFRDRERGEYNRSEDPEWIRCEPIWITAERQGVRAAVSNWVGSYGGWGGIQATYHDDRFVDRSDAQAIQRVLKWLRMPEMLRPGLILAYLKGADHVGHRFGPESESVAERLLVEDRNLSSFLNDLDGVPDHDRITVLVLTDHGMADRTRRVDPTSLLFRRRIAARVYASGGCANVYLARKADRERAAELLSTLPGLQVFPGEALPTDLHYRFVGRTGDLVLLAAVGVDLAPQGTDGEQGRGVHGYRGTAEPMGGIFYAWGAGIRRGAAVDEMRAVDVYSLACRLLRIRPSSRSQGRVPPDILTRPPG